MVRKLDDLGRIVLPIEIRKTLGIENRDALEIFIDGDKIVLTKYQPSCIFCAEVKNVVHFGGKMICRDCLVKLHDLA